MEISEWTFALSLVGSAAIAVSMVILLQRTIILKSDKVLQDFFQDKALFFIEEVLNDFPAMKVLFRGRVREKIENKVHSYLLAHIPSVQKEVVAKITSLFPLFLIVNISAIVIFILIKIST